VNGELLVFLCTISFAQFAYAPAQATRWTQSTNRENCECTSTETSSAFSQLLANQPKLNDSDLFHTNIMLANQSCWILLVQYSRLLIMSRSNGGLYKTWPRSAQRTALNRLTRLANIYSGDEFLYAPRLQTVSCWTSMALRRFGIT
jgi:hypothetical protein